MRSDKAAAVRGAQGVLVTAEPQAKAGGLHLARDMLNGQADAAEALAKQAAELARTHQAGETDTQPQAELRQRLKDWEMGSNTRPGDPVATAAQPMVALSGPAGVVIGSPQSTWIATGHVLELSSGLHAQRARRRRPTPGAAWNGSR